MKKILIAFFATLPLITQATQLNVTFYNDSEPGGAFPLTIHIPEQSSISCLNTYGLDTDKIINVDSSTGINLGVYDSSNSSLGNCKDRRKTITWNISAPNVSDGNKISSNITITLKQIAGFWNTEVSINTIDDFNSARVNMKSALCTYSILPNNHYDCRASKGGVSYGSKLLDENIAIHLERTFDIPKK